MRKGLRKYVHRPVSAPIDSWAKWTTLAELMGVQRDTLITAVMDAAYDYLRPQFPDGNMLRGKEISPGRGIADLKDVK